MIDYCKLIPDMHDDQGEPWIDIFGWLSINCKYDQLIASGWLFWPTFFEYNGCILIDMPCKSNYKENYKRLISSGQVERGYVEERLNRMEIADILSRSEDQPLTLEQAKHIGELLKQMWGAKLSIDYPDREFIVSFIVYEEDKADDLKITFCQKESFLIDE